MRSYKRRSSIKVNANSILKNIKLINQSLGSWAMGVINVVREWKYLCISYGKLELITTKEYSRTAKNMMC
jgi:hypothetical protein